MYCRKCGSEIQDGAKFCSKCGAETVISNNIAATAKKGITLSRKSKIAIISVSCMAVLCVLLFFVFRETPETKVIKAVEKMQNEKQVDMVVDINADIYSGDQTITLQQRMEIQSDATKTDNPLSAMRSTTFVNSNTYVVNSYYKDGYSYAESEYSKIKTAVDFDEFQKEYMKLTEDLVINPKEDVPNATIKKRDNGDIHAKFDISGEKFTSVISNLLEEWIGEFSLNLDSNSVCSLTVVVGKNNTIEQMQFDYNFSIDCNGSTVNIDYEAIYSYNKIDDDFTIVFPEDLDTYDLKVAEISSGFAIKNSSKETILDANHVDKISICEINDGYSVKLTLTDNGKNIFSQYTTNNTNTTSYVCVYDATIMAPVIPEPITDGVLTIPMNTYEEAEDLFDSLS